MGFKERQATATIIIITLLWFLRKTYLFLCDYSE